MIRKLPIIPTIVVLAAVATMVALGFWQLGRLEEKEALIARYEAAQSHPSYAPIRADLPEAAYTTTMANCAKVVEVKTVAGRNAKGEAGFAHVARCMSGGQWSATSPEDGTPDQALDPEDIVIGWSRTPQPAKWAGGKLSGTVVPTGELGYKIVADPPLAGLQANARPDPNDIPNNHLAYAVQWFLFAATALVIYALALRKKWQERA